MKHRQECKDTLIKNLKNELKEAEEMKAATEEREKKNLEAVNENIESIKLQIEALEGLK